VSDLPRDEHFSIRESNAAHAHAGGCVPACEVGVRHAAAEFRKRSLFEARFKVKLEGTDRLVARPDCARGCIHPDHQTLTPVQIERRT
jgi:hypothetical protein